MRARSLAPSRLGVRRVRKKTTARTRDMRASGCGTEPAVCSCSLARAKAACAAAAYDDGSCADDAERGADDAERGADDAERGAGVDGEATDAIQSVAAVASSATTSVAPGRGPEAMRSPLSYQDRGSSPTGAQVHMLMPAASGEALSPVARSDVDRHASEESDAQVRTVGLSEATVEPDAEVNEEPSSLTSMTTEDERSEVVV